MSRNLPNYYTPPPPYRLAPQPPEVYGTGGAALPEAEAAALEQLVAGYSTTPQRLEDALRSMLSLPPAPLGLAAARLLLAFFHKLRLPSASAADGAASSAAAAQLLGSVLGDASLPPAAAC